MNVSTWGITGAIAAVASLEAGPEGFAEAMLSAQARRLHHLIDAIPQFVWTASAEGRLSYANSAWRNCVGAREGELAEAVIRDWLHPDDRDRWLAGWRGALECGRPYEMEYRLRGGPGREWQWYLERGVRRDDGDAAERWFVTATLLDTQKHREEEMRRQLRSEEQYLATVAHELRNPLAPIANAIALLARKGGDRATVDVANAVIQRQLAQLTRLIDDLLDISRMTNGRMALQFELVDIESIAAAAMETARPLIESRQHTLSWAAAAEPLQVRGDAARLVQVVTNLLINAAKYTSPGGCIALSARLESGRAALRVKDNGMGIAPETLPRIFDAFAQAEPGGDSGMGGLGLGLSVARQLVLLHGGTIEAYSDGLARGAEFVVTLPLSS